MIFKEGKVVERCTKIRTENGKIIRYVVTDDSYEDTYGWESTYNAWRIEDGVAKCLTNNCRRYMEWDAQELFNFGQYVKCKCCNRTRFVREEDFNKQPKFYSQKEVDKMTSEAYNQGYEDGKVYFYGMTSKDEERVKQIAKTL